MDPPVGSEDGEAFLAAPSRPQASPRQFTITPILQLQILPRTSNSCTLLPKRRLWNVLCGGLVFVIGLYFLGAFRRPARPESHRQRNKVYKYGPSHCSERVNWTTTTGFTDHEYGEEFTYHAQTRFTVPISAEELRFVSEGALQHGSFEVVQDHEAGSDSALIDVHVSYHHPDGLDDATVCRFHPGKGTWGLGIFTPHSHTPHLEQNFRFHVILRLPLAELDAPLHLTSLFTDIPLFSHQFPHLAGSVSLDSVKLRGWNAPVTIESISAKRVSVRTDNGVVRGTFSASTSMEFQTSNAPISVYATLVSHAKSEQASTLLLKTTNGRIDGDITLKSNSTDSAGGAFRVFTHSSNAPLVLAVVDAPIDSALDLTARTSNAPARVKLHKTFEGALDLSSSTFFRPEVHWARAEDPAGRGRERHVYVDTIRGSRVRGDVLWEEGGENRGKVVLETSNAALSLTV